MTFYPLPETMVLPRDAIKAAMVTNVVGISLYIILLFQFNELSNQVYEDVKNTNEAIENSTKEKEAFFATISHEIRNPLQSMLGSIELLNDSHIQSDCKATPLLLDICKNCCAIVINMVSNILDMSKIAADKMQLSPVAADLRELVSRILRISRSRAEGKNLDLECDSELPPSVEVDTQRIEQIVLNLISNSIKFTSKGRVVVKISWKPFQLGQDVTSLVKETLAQSSWKASIDFSETSTRDRRFLSRKYLKLISPAERRHLQKDTVEYPHDPSPQLSAQRDTDPKQGVVKIEVMDTGIGIQKDSICKLFKPYQQANSSISRKYGGTGLGL
ncbi:MAG: ATP-binding protein, partial [Candidatus Pacebacteria bacterium]|nr:ATP-binding protein [Candidatus Paceibacterota bacterium]